jgi:hypothetical protein
MQQKTYSAKFASGQKQTRGLIKESGRERETSVHPLKAIWRPRTVVCLITQRVYALRSKLGSI